MSLERAILEMADLTSAFLWRSNQETPIRSAILRGVIMDGAILKGANLACADLRGARGVTQYQLRDAADVTDALLPLYLR